MELKKSVVVVRKKGIYHLLGEHNKLKRFKPWLGDIFSFLYDRIMEKSIFPKKFDGSLDKHIELLKNEFENVHNKKILEFATGSGNAVYFLNRDNRYTGVDISPGLLRIANKRFFKHDFVNSELYNADACDTPFRDNCFDLAICNLSLNFFQNIEDFIVELRRVLKKNGVFFCSVPLPEKKRSQVKIRGNLFSADDLRDLFEKHNFEFEPQPYENGALFYFKSRKVV